MTTYLPPRACGTDTPLHSLALLGKSVGQFDPTEFCIRYLIDIQRCDEHLLINGPDLQDREHGCINYYPSSPPPLGQTPCFRIASVLQSKQASQTHTHVPPHTQLTEDEQASDTSDTRARTHARTRAHTKYHTHKHTRKHMHAHRQAGFPLPPAPCSVAVWHRHQGLSLSLGFGIRAHPSTSSSWYDIPAIAFW